MDTGGVLAFSIPVTKDITLDIAGSTAAGTTTLGLDIVATAGVISEEKAEGGNQAFMICGGKEGGSMYGGCHFTCQQGEGCICSGRVWDDRRCQYGSRGVLRD